MRRRAACSDRSRGGWSRISSVGANEPQLLIFLVAAFDLIETPSRIDLFRMPSSVRSIAFAIYSRVFPDPASSDRTIFLIGPALPNHRNPSISPSPSAQALQAGESILSRTICRSIYPTVCPHLPSLGDLRVRPWACKFSGLGGGTAFCRLGHKLRLP